MRCAALLLVALGLSACKTGEKQAAVVDAGAATAAEVVAPPAVEEKIPPGPTKPLPYPKFGKVELTLSGPKGEEKLVGEVDACVSLGLDGFELRSDGKRGKAGYFRADVRSKHRFRRMNGEVDNYEPALHVMTDELNLMLADGARLEGVQQGRTFRFDHAMAPVSDDATGPFRVKGVVTCPEEPLEPAVGEDVLTTLRKIGGPRVRPYLTHEFGRQRRFLGASVIVDTSKAQSVAAQLRAALPGWTVYIGTTRFLPNFSESTGTGWKHDVPDWWGPHERAALTDGSAFGGELSFSEVVVTGAAPPDVLLVAHSPNEDTGPQPMEAWRVVKGWHDRFGVEISAAEPHGFTLRLLKRPPNANALTAGLEQLDERLVEDEDLRKDLAAGKTVSFYW